MDTPLISVVIPVYNTERYLQECLDSIGIEQYEDVEIILVDDGSTDSSAEICDAYAKNHADVTVIHTENCGVSYARNTGKQKAVGHYLMFLDSDDILVEDQFKKAHDYLLDGHCDLVIMGYFKVSEQGEILKEERNSIEKVTAETLCCRLIHGTLKICMGSLFVGKKIADLFDFYTGTKYGEDVEYIYRCILTSRAPTLLDGELVCYREHGGSAIARVGLNRFDVFFARQRIYEYVLETYPQYRRLLYELETFNLPEAVADTIRLLSYNQVGFRRLDAYMKENGLSTWLIDHKDDSRIDSQFLNVIRQWESHPRVYYSRQYLKRWVYTTKRWLYIMARGKDNV